MDNFKIKSCLLLMLCFFLVTDYPVRIRENISWTPPVQLSKDIENFDGKQADAAYPDMVADSTGIVHSFWPAKIDPELGSIGEAMYYSRWDGSAWSQPVDIFYLPGRWIWKPQVDIDKEDRIHAVWVYNDFVWYTHVKAVDAGFVKAWSKPIQVSNELATDASVAVGPDGVLHIAYSTKGKVRRIHYTRSDNGEVWLLPIELFFTKEWFLPKLDVDERNRVHLVFGALGAGDAVYYMRSDETGLNWADPVVIDKRDDRYGGEYGPAWINLITHGTDEVHLVWDGAPYGQRWHQWSRDGGESWSTANQISEQVRGLTGTNEMGFDNTGLMHFFTLGIKGTPPYYATWQSGTWSSLEPVASQYYWDGEGPTMAVTGDQVVTSWWNRSEAAIEIFACSLKINVWPVASDTPAVLAGRPRSTYSPTITSSPTATLKVPEVTPTSLLHPTITNDLLRQSVPLPLSKILILSSLPALLTTGIIYIFRRTKR